METFFINQYQGIFSFLHKPSVLDFMNSDLFNPEICLRDYFVKYESQSQSASLRYLDPDLISASNASKHFGLEASKHFGYHARNLMKDVFGKPRLLNIQAFTLLSIHEWREGNNARSLFYVSIAFRMALILGITSIRFSSVRPYYSNYIRMQAVYCIVRLYDGLLPHKR